MEVVPSKFISAINIAFKLGYQRGERAVGAKPAKEPKTRNEIRQSITYTVRNKTEKH